MMYNLKDLNLLSKVFTDVIVAHNGEVRKSEIGSVVETTIPYVSHSIRVGTLLMEEGTPAEVVAAGYGHDIKEDQPEFNIEHWPTFTKQLINNVTKVGNENKTDSIMRVKGNKYAILLKMADRFDNSSRTDEFSKLYREKENVIESTELLLQYAKETGLDKSNIYKNLKNLFKL